jgi:motility quorum-sensing regulator / GCU-specific mRNA interferase toxin
VEKRTPHCRLAVVKAMIAAGKVRATVSALAGGAALGFGFGEIVGVVAALTPRDFYKSMTTHPITASGRTSTGRRRRPARCI